MKFDAKTVLRYLGFFAIFFGLGIFLNIFSGQPIDWVGNFTIALILIVGWILIDWSFTNKAIRDEEKKRKEMKNLTKAEKKAYAEAAAARKKREEAGETEPKKK